MPDSWQFGPTPLRPSRAAHATSWAGDPNLHRGGFASALSCCRECISRVRHTSGLSAFIRCPSFRVVIGLLGFRRPSHTHPAHSSLHYLPMGRPTETLASDAHSGKYYPRLSTQGDGPAGNEETCWAELRRLTPCGGHQTLEIRTGLGGKKP